MTARTLTCVFVLTAAMLGLTNAAAEAASTQPTIFSVSCSSEIGTLQQPTASGYRIVLGRISVPPSYNPQVVPLPGHWPYWRKAGVAVRAGNASVTVSVPSGWRSRAAITWGNSLAVEALRFSGCEPRSGPIEHSPSGVYASHAWNAYAGGFYLRASSACIPLIFTSDDRRATSYFGIGRHCPKSP